jgi:hypothetical protein
MRDDVRVEFTPWRMSQSQFRYRGEPNVIDLASCEGQSTGRWSLFVQEGRYSAPLTLDRHRRFSAPLVR